MVPGPAAVAGLLGLGLVMGFSPTLYGIVLHLLTRRAAPLRLVIAVTAGMAAASTVLLLAFHSVDPETLIATWRGRVTAILLQRSVDLVAGVVLLAAGAVVWSLRTRRRRGRRPHLHEGTPRELFVLGFVETILGVSDLATMYVTGRVISAATPVLLWRLVEYCVFLLTLVGPYLAAAYVWERVPAFAARVTAGYSWIVDRDLRPALAIALLATGVVFVLLAIWAR